MMRVYKRRMYGDIANLSIGQGDADHALQMAQAMAAIGNGGTLYQTRLVSQVQSVDSQIVTAYDVRARGVLSITDKTLKTLRRGMVAVVSSRMGTAGRAQVDRVDVAATTATAQWGPKQSERTAAWFAGFSPADEPLSAFAPLYEGDANEARRHERAAHRQRAQRNSSRTSRATKKKKYEEEVDEVGEASRANDW